MWSQQMHSWLGTSDRKKFNLFAQAREERNNAIRDETEVREEDQIIACVPSVGLSPSFTRYLFSTFYAPNTKSSTSNGSTFNKPQSREGKELCK